MRYVRNFMYLSDIMKKALKRLDKDHIHYMIETETAMSISKIVNLIKSYTTYHIWKRYPNDLRKHFGRNALSGQTDILRAVLGAVCQWHTLSADRSRAETVSEEMLRKYIENQG